ncbi:MAG: hypothetical protein U9Q33_13195 [Campylobacterota bacterium]|nr:hypothetical protein [Campylobacterota bacterium]
MIKNISALIVVLIAIGFTGCGGDTQREIEEIVRTVDSVEENLTSSNDDAVELANILPDVSSPTEDLEVK